jgi:hypothetical protein
MLFTLGIETRDFGLDGVIYFGFNFFFTINKNSIEKNTLVRKKHQNIVQGHKGQFLPKSHLTEAEVRQPTKQNNQFYQLRMSCSMVKLS